MKRNDTFSQLLADYRPDLGDNRRYLQHLSDRLAQVETVKHFYETERRRWRNRLIVALVSGGIGGVLSTLYFIVHPIRPVCRLWLFHLGTTSVQLERVSTFATPLLITMFTVSFAVIATLFYRIVKKDFAA